MYFCSPVSRRLASSDECWKALMITGVKCVLKLRVLPRQTPWRASPSTCLLSPAEKHTGGPGTVNPLNTPLSSLMPHQATHTSNHLPPDVPAVCPTPQHHAEVRMHDSRGLMMMSWLYQPYIVNQLCFCVCVSSDSVTKTSTPSFRNGKTAAAQQGSPWETLVVFAINLKQLNVQMNMSNVMGNNTYETYRNCLISTAVYKCNISV